MGMGGMTVAVKIGYRGVGWGTKETGVGRGLGREKRGREG